MLRCVVFSCVIRCAAVFMFCCSVLRCIACYDLLWCVTVCCGVLRCVTVCYSVLRCVTVIPQYLKIIGFGHRDINAVCCGVFSVTDCCGVLRFVAVTLRCGVLRCDPVWYSKTSSYWIWSQGYK